MSSPQHTEPAPSTHDAQLLDHNYDGIQEFDNPTPGWWHLIFLATVLFCFPYIVIVHFNPEYPSYDQSLSKATEVYQLAEMKKIGKLALDEDTVRTAMGIDKFLAMGARVFRTNCVSCHAANGQGLVGPNLTDDHYKNVKVLMDIPKVITEGAAAGAMPSWRGRLSQNEVVTVSAYVASLRGKNEPGPRGKEGDLIPPFPPAKVPAETPANPPSSSPAEAAKSKA